MKPRTTSILLILTFGLAASAPAGESLRAKAMLKATPRITDLTLKKQQAATFPGGSERAVSMKELRPTVRRSRKDVESLIARSTIISTPTHWTIVPKEAVLHVPGHFKSRVDGKRSGRLLPWNEFYILNRNWIRTQSVDLAQASGKIPLKEKTRQVYRDVGRVVVAVCQGGPISVKAPPLEMAAVEPASDAPR